MAMPLLEDLNNDMQEHLPQSNTISALSGVSRRLYSDKYLDRFPDTDEKDFVCPCCGKTKDVSEARIKRIVHESNKVGVRTIHTTTETFSFRLCEDCFENDDLINGRAVLIFWLSFALILILGIAVSFTIHEIYPAMASTILGFVIAFYIKKSYKWLASERYGTNVSYKRACDCNAIVS